MQTQAGTQIGPKTDCAREKLTLGSRGLMGPWTQRYTRKKNGGGAEEEAAVDKSLPSCRFTVLE